MRSRRSIEVSFGPGLGPVLGGNVRRSVVVYGHRSTKRAFRRFIRQCRRELRKPVDWLPLQLLTMYVLVIGPLGGGIWWLMS